MLTTSEELEELVNMFHQGTRHSYQKGEFIVRPGESPPGVFYIESGFVKAYDITKYGEENLLVFRKSGEFIALTWTITGIDKHIIYSATSPTVVWQISRTKFLTFLQKHPEAALPVIEMVVDMYRIHSERILNLEYRTVRERLISFLLTTSNRFGTKVKDGLLIEVPLRHQDIASSINASRETTSREMAHLERKGLIYNKQLYITLRDIDQLQSYL
jgi:CRP/FNR family transcriptional regulator, cyclic AMP receptor protein